MTENGVFGEYTNKQPCRTVADTAAVAAGCRHCDRSVLPSPAASCQWCGPRIDTQLVVAVNWSAIELPTNRAGICGVCAKTGATLRNNSVNHVGHGTIGATESTHT